MQGYLASGIFNGLGLQSVGACPQHTAQLSAARINGNLMKPPYGEAAGGGAGRVAVSREIGILKYQIRSRYTMNENSLSKEFSEPSEPIQVPERSNRCMLRQRRRSI
jgi:hypothetical protein